MTPVGEEIIEEKMAMRELLKRLGTDAADAITLEPCCSQGELSPANVLCILHEKVCAP